MKTLKLAVAVVIGTAFAVASAEAASNKRKSPRPDRPAVTAKHPHDVYFHDGDLLGRDPDPFIRLMLLRAGRISDQSGP